MDMNKVLNELDALFAKNDLNGVGKFLKEQYEIAKSEDDFGARLSLANEMVGFYREMTAFDKAQEIITDMEELLKDERVAGTVEEGTSLLNIANTYRAMGRFEDSKSVYDRAAQLYEGTLEENDFRLASLYNNVSLLYQAQECYEQAEDSLLSALKIAKNHPEAEVEIAITYTNLGQLCLQGKGNDPAKAEAYLKQAEELFEKGDKQDYHYCGCANALGTLYFMKGEYDGAVKYYEEALLNMHNTAGATENFDTIRENLMSAYEKAGMKTYDNTMDLCEAYYEKYGKPMIHEKFPEYEDKIAVGLCGEGSECFGFDDELSLDHDCGPRFCMWITDEVFEEIGMALQKEYEKLPKIFAGSVLKRTPMGGSRDGVHTIDNFYSQFLERPELPETREDWWCLDGHDLATATNGRVFVDKQGIFTAIREYLLKYYPRDVWIERIATSLIYCAQSGQYNYPRMMARGDYVTARLALSEYMKHIMDVVFLLNRTYPPYYKWQHSAMARLSILPEVGDILTAICDMEDQREAWKDVKYGSNVNEKDMIAVTIEIIAKLIVDQ
ncbi:MAG: DUF4037 domain-containing protein, partial [Alistipes sp.]|nr:DUF4037 domain-containing protein [Alistipes sp.]